jgi:hypothetical protein
MTPRIDLDLLDRTGRSIEQHGIAAVPQSLLTDIAHEAVRLGVRPVLAAVLAGTDHPAVARERAFGSLASGVAHAKLHGAWHRDTPLAA